jgi:hypothetical protein
MTRLQKIIFRVCFIVILILSGCGIIMPLLSYAPNVDVGPDVVSVYEPYPNERPDLLIPVMRMDTPDSVVDTGKKVGATIRSNYQYQNSQRLSRLTMVVLFIGWGTYYLAGLGRKKAA